jgi:Tfp pilus assembly protein PilO
MKRLSKEKRDQLILVCIVTLMVLVGIWFMLIRAQKESLQALRDQKETKQKKVSQMQDEINKTQTVETELNSVSAKLADREQDMVSGDYYASLVNTVRRFKLAYKLDIPQFSPAASVTEVDLLPKFPYKQVRIAISGTGFYEDIGKFIADFENQYSASRVVNLELTPYTGSADAKDTKEKLTFRMEIVSLVASGVVAPANSK